MEIILLRSFNLLLHRQKGVTTVCWWEWRDLGLQNLGTVWVGRDLEDHLIPTPSLTQGSHQAFPKVWLLPSSALARNGSGWNELHGPMCASPPTSRAAEFPANINSTCDPCVFGRQKDILGKTWKQTCHWKWWSSANCQRVEKQPEIWEVPAGIVPSWDGAVPPSARRGFSLIFPP